MVVARYTFGERNVWVYMSKIFYRRARRARKGLFRALDCFFISAYSACSAVNLIGSQNTET